VNPYEYLEKGKEDIPFPSFDALMGHLNEYVGENCRFTSIVKYVTLYMDKPELAEISVVDTPGMNDAIASRTDRTREFIEQCDIVFFLSRGSQFLDTNDMKLIADQLPQKGVENLILICSQFDSALQDELRKCGSLRATIDKVKKKINEQVKETFSAELKNNNRAHKFIENCSEPIFISSVINNMINKPETEFSRNEAFIYKIVNKFGDLTTEIMQEIGNIQAVRDIFAKVSADKDITLQKKAKNFVPTVRNEWNATVKELKNEAQRRRNTLESGDKEKLEKQKKIMESQISGIKASLEIVLGDLRISLEQAKGDISRKLRENCRENSKLQERTGTEYHTNRYKVTTGFLWWKNSHYEYSNYTTTYTYISTSDALENIRTFGAESCSQIESAFYKAVDIKSAKRRLMQTILDNFDSGDENFDINYFRQITEATLNRIEFPVIRIDINPFIQKISSQFSGEVKSSGDRAKIQNLLSETMDTLYNVVSEQFIALVGSFRESLDNMQEEFSSRLLSQIQEEFDTLCRQVEDKENSIENYNKLLSLLDTSVIL
ncbi:MAG: dynamin family protein, partial [Ruminococcus sp.]|nr:dynamin family protein [Ruminococcus sp.]